MKKSIIIIKKNLFIYNEEEYDFDKVDEMNNLLKSNLKIIILEEELYVKQFTSEIKRNKMYEFIDYKINNEFPQNGDILYDFERNNNIISIYYIKGAKRIEKICETAKNIEVKPIQFIVKDVMMKILKTNIFNCKVFIKFNEYYYYISFKEGLFYYGLVEKDKEIVWDKISQNDDFGEIYVDNSLCDLPITNKLNIIKMNIGELINAKIYEKQRFHSRKIL
ncbi:MAG: hypothetical protein LLF98_09190 [Clostridium sp.]|uniref:hypothetical protein n=1 Tax=Clostridium sp. TaxID=1506 RepID=UPI0025B7B5AF|nr:hypothetical protein [Clostridium sp.]MCE5221417.1 hypothetical protein [Clostridium sp.]